MDPSDVWKRHIARVARATHRPPTGAIGDDPGEVTPLTTATSDGVVAAVAMAVGAVLIADAMLVSGQWGTGATIGLFLCVVSARALVRKATLWLWRRFRGSG